MVLPSSLTLEKGGFVQVSVALIKEQGVEFAVVAVKNHAIANQSEARDAIAEFEVLLGVPVVVTAFVGARPKYVGRPDLVRWLSGVIFEALPCRTLTLSQG